MSNTTRLLELIDDYSACVMSFIRIEDYFQNYPKTDYFTKATDQERRLWTERAKKNHPSRR